MYTTKQKVQNYLMTNIDSSFDTQVTEWISGVEKFINKYTGREDGFEATSKTKYFDGNNEREIMIDAFTSLSSVQILNVNSTDVGWTLTEGLDQDYITYPTNETPKYKLKLVASSSIGSFYAGPSRIKITGNFGYSDSVPADIELAATILVAEIVKQGRDGGIAVTQGLGDYSTSFESFNDAVLRITEVHQILNRYKLLTL
jgi:hypothetical protein